MSEKNEVDRAERKERAYFALMYLDEQANHPARAPWALKALAARMGSEEQARALIEEIRASQAGE